MTNELSPKDFDRIYRDVWSSMPSRDRLWRFAQAIYAAALASQAAEPVYSDNPADDNYLCPAGRAQRGLPPLASETAAGAVSDSDYIRALAFNSSLNSDPIARAHHLRLMAIADSLATTSAAPKAPAVPETLTDAEIEDEEDAIDCMCGD